MDACPYCGEAVDDPRAVRCPRCDAALGPGAAGGDGDMDLVELTDDEIEAEGFDDLASPRSGGAAGGKKVASAPCPHCGKPVKANKHRCTHCGRALRELVDDEVVAEHQRYKRNIRKGLAAGAAALALGLLVLGWLSLPGDEPPETKSYLRKPLAEMAGYYGPNSRLDADKLERMWDRSHKESFVAWTGRVAEVEPGGLFSDAWLRVEAEAGGERVGLRIFAPGEEVAKASVGARVRFEGQLAAYGNDPLFTLRFGSIEVLPER